MAILHLLPSAGRRICLLLIVIWCFAQTINNQSLGSRFYTQPCSPVALNLPPSEMWDGIDGAWSSFLVQIGQSPPQFARVLPSISRSDILVIDPAGCTENEYLITPNGTSGDVVEQCSDSRGLLVDVTKSGTAIIQGVTNITLEPNLKGENAEVEAKYSVDYISMYTSTGAGGNLDLVDRVVGGVTSEKLWMGLMGLLPDAVPSHDGTESSTRSLLQYLFDQFYIPSLSFGYHAGATYKSVPASLVLGGIDAERGATNKNATFKQNIDRLFQVELKSLTMTTPKGSSSRNLLSPNSLPTVIQTETPYLWLPIDLCSKLESLLNLTWNNEYELYLLNNAQHSFLQELNPTFRFEITNTIKDGNMKKSNITIELPYAALDLETSLIQFGINQTSKYFPLKRANSPDQYALGRAFLQEVYLIADFHRDTFTISPVSSNNRIKSNVRSIYPPDGIPWNNCVKPNQKMRNDILALCVILVPVIGLVVWHKCKGWKRKPKLGERWSDRGSRSRLSSSAGSFVTGSDLSRFSYPFAGRRPPAMHDV